MTACSGPKPDFKFLYDVNLPIKVEYVATHMSFSLSSDLCAAVVRRAACMCTCLSITDVSHFGDIAINPSMMQDKIEAIAKGMYHAAGVSYTPEAEAQVSLHFASMPRFASVCSLCHDPNPN